MHSQHPSRPLLRLVGEPEDFHHGAWRDGKQLVLHQEATLPDRCILCNQPAEGFALEKRLYWHSPLLLPLLVVNFFLYAFLAFLLKRSHLAAVPLCPRHRRRRQALGLLGILLLPAFPLCAVAGITLGEPRLLLPGLLLSLAGGVVLLLGRNEVWAYRISGDYAYVRGADPAWLSVLPPWHEPDE